ncbi:hypothetical protein ABNQ39_20460 [Azospirillum sp. A26]|uniref:hypothetical protein n=1 Tax=Azospirillum sp. A26 TaxID=3160607 RepID=UPI00366BD923
MKIEIGRTYSNKKGTSHRLVVAIGVQYRPKIEGIPPANYRNPMAPGVRWWSPSGYGNTMLNTFELWAAKEVEALRPE